MWRHPGKIHALLLQCQRPHVEDSDESLFTSAAEKPYA